MKSIFTISKSFALITAILVLTVKTNISFGQIITYTDDTLGALNFVATHATGTSLTRVNGATIPTFICQNGFSSKTFNTSTAFSDTFRAIEVTVTPSASHTLNVTGFTADLRRSNTGPVNARFAYSIDGGTTWTDQGSDQTPMHAGCDTLTTIPWTSSFTVTAPSMLKFRVYGYNASASTGTFQIKNLSINGTVTGTVSLPEVGVGMNNIMIFPNPVEQTTKLSYHLNAASKVNISIYSLIGQEVVKIINNETQQPGEYSYAASINVPGIYFAKFTIGENTYTRKIVKL